MNHHSTQPSGRTTSSCQTPEHPIIRGFLDGTAGLFDISLRRDQRRFTLAVRGLDGGH
jgi:hypothetical protein